jgi:hypothetical protein
MISKINRGFKLEMQRSMVAWCSVFPPPEKYLMRNFKSEYFLRSVVHLRYRLLHLFLGEDQLHVFGVVLP